MDRDEIILHIKAVQNNIEWKLLENKEYNAIDIVSSVIDKYIN